jgi:hypothetical protein
VEYKIWIINQHFLTAALVNLTLGLAMAILPSLPGLEVQICISGKQALEYADPTQTSLRTNKISKYIEAKTGKEFSIVVRMQSPFEIDSTAIVTRVEVDGINVLGPLFRKERYEDKECLLSHSIHGVPERNGVRTFKFVEFPKSKSIDR